MEKDEKYYKDLKEKILDGLEDEPKKADLGILGGFIPAIVAINVGMVVLSQITQELKES